MEHFAHFFIDHEVLRSMNIHDPNRLLVEYALDSGGHAEMHRLATGQAHETRRRYLAGGTTPTTPKKR